MSDVTSIDTTKPQASGIHYLKGDEIAVLPRLIKPEDKGSHNGRKQKDTITLNFLDVGTAIMSNYYPTRVAVKASPVNLREAIFFLSPEEAEDINIVNQKAVEATSSKSKERIKNNIRNQAKPYRVFADNHKKVPEAWNDPEYDFTTENKRGRTIADNLRIEQLKGLDKPPKIEKGKDIDESGFGRVLGAEFADGVKILESLDARLFPDSFKTIFSHRFFPFIIRGKNERMKDTTMDIRGGLILSYDTVQGLQSDDNSTFQNALTPFSSDLISAIANIAPISTEELGIRNKDDWKAVSDEFKQSYGLLGMQDPGVEFNPIKILGSMHCLFNTPSFTRETLYEQYPLCSNMYDRFMIHIQEHAAELEAEPDKRKRKNRPGATLPRPNDILWKFAPTPISNNEPLEIGLINGVRDFVQSALRGNPPHNQCSVRLVSSRNQSGTGNYIITFTMRNSNREDREFTVSTNTNNLSQAIELKKRIQSHLLSHHAIEPLWMSELHKDAGDQNNVMLDEVIPNTKPVDTKLVNQYDFYALQMTFEQPTFDQSKTKKVTVWVPLGLPYSASDTATRDEAAERQRIVGKHLRELRDKGRWETVSEVTQHLKRIVKDKETPRAFGWQASKRIAVEGFDGVRTDLSFPNERQSEETGQITTLNSAKIVLETGGGHPNPTWRLNMGITVTGLGPDGTEVYKLNPTLNLHTEDEIAAQVRAKHAIDDVANTFSALALSYPKMRWETVNDEANLVIRDIAGNKPSNPDPQSFSEIHQDIEPFKTNFQIVEREQEATRHDNGRIYITLGVQRGTVAEGDLVDFKYDTIKRAVSVAEYERDDDEAIEAEENSIPLNQRHQPIRLEFSVDESEASKIPEIIGNVNRVFKSYIDEAYSNRTMSTEGEIIRKKPQKYNPRTIENIFFEAFANEVAHGNSSNSIRPSYVRYQNKVYNLDEMSDATINRAAKEGKSRLQTGQHPEPMWTDDDEMSPKSTVDGSKLGGGKLLGNGPTEQIPLI